jgi:hypothetical protein
MIIHPFQFMEVSPYDSEKGRGQKHSVVQDRSPHNVTNTSPPFCKILERTKGASAICKKCFIEEIPKKKIPPILVIPGRKIFAAILTRPYFLGVSS